MRREAIIGFAIGILGGGIGAGLQLTGTIAPVLGWVIIGICVIIGVFLVGYGFGKGKGESAGSPASQSTTNLPITLQDGSIESITRGDMSFIVSQLATPMSWNHGHWDIEGLISDRASGIPLNELMGRPCSRCGVARNQKGRDI
ncbi:MAG TPA: hypothetical protein VMV76_07720 [Dehalococcoidia bacterium]|nr:hypothetical protein [Dehalococcoidia bacterium]